MDATLIHQPLARVRYYTHFFTVEPLSSRIVGVLFKFLQPYVEKVWYQERGGKPYLVPGKVFAGRTQDNQEFRLHMGQLSGFLHELQLAGVDLNLIEQIAMPDYQGKKHHFDFTKTPRDYQERARDFALSVTPADWLSALIAIPTGGGKEQPLHSLIKVPGGWARMGEMHVGKKVLAGDGSVTQVTGVYPQGRKAVYRFTFSDGRTAEAGLEHLWKIYVEHRDPLWRTANTAEIMRLLEKKTTRCYIPLVTPHEGVDAELPMDPYIVGLMLGNGGMSGQTIRYSTQDQCTVDKINTYFEPYGIELVHVSDYDYSFRRSTDYKGMRLGSMLARIKQLGLHGRLSYDKFVPPEYLEGSRVQRLALVQGLLDSDGTVGKHGGISYCSSSKQLAYDFQYLIQSLGGIAYVATKKPFYTYKGQRLEGRLSYIVHVRYKTPKELFQVKRKQDRLQETNQYSEGLKLRVEKVEFVGYEETQCIAIDHPDHLYVTDNFVVTHNTVVFCSVIQAVAQNFAVVVLPKYMEKWGGDLEENLGLKKKEIMMVAGSKQVKGLIHLLKEGKKTPAATIISLTTLQSFFDSYEEDPKQCLQDYGCIPQDLWRLMQVGLVGVDEAHEHLYSVFRLTLNLHGPRFVALSGTMLSEDPFVDKIQNTIFPQTIRFNEIKMKKYIKATSLAYTFANFQNAKIRTTEFGRTTYSHVAFEKSILKQPRLLAAYLAMIKDIVDDGYIYGKMEGDRLAVYAATIDMCSYITGYLKKAYPSLDVRRYVEKDPYKNVIEPDIRVTTIISAGTAIDIPKLRVVINTISISSHKANYQQLGRLRELQDRDVKMYWIYCENIPKQCDYHFKRVELFADRTASIKQLKLPHRL